jgi:hypothetical protein
MPASSFTFDDGSIGDAAVMENEVTSGRKEFEEAIQDLKAAEGITPEGKTAGNNTSGSAASATDSTSETDPADLLTTLQRMKIDRQKWEARKKVVDSRADYVRQTLKDPERADMEIWKQNDIGMPQVGDITFYNCG